MGVVVFLRYNDRTMEYIKLYTCSNCNMLLYESYPRHIENLSRDPIQCLTNDIQLYFSRISHICNCGEKLTTTSPMYDIIIDMIINE